MLRKLRRRLKKNPAPPAPPHGKWYRDQQKKLRNKRKAKARKEREG
jgi:hypothetical protein